mgnify:CR=1 FL=1
MKRILTIQDYSARGRCSLTVALPILSACEVETIGLPTAVLSNHTAFSSFTYHDLSSERFKSVENWKNYNHHFDRIYTGYLGNGQVPIVLKIIRELKEEDTLIVVDPAFGEKGKLYSGFQQDHVLARRELAMQADLLLPNLTEACFLTGKEYHEGFSQEELRELLLGIVQLNQKDAVLTGIRSKEKVGALWIKGKQQGSYFTTAVDAMFHGGGDTFASSLCGCLLNGLSRKEAVKVSHDFTHRARLDSLKDHIDPLLYGLEFEKELSYLHNRIAFYKRKNKE